jgi:hypothetical protein
MFMPNLRTACKEQVRGRVFVSKWPNVLHGVILHLLQKDIKRKEATVALAGGLFGDTEGRLAWKS